MTDKMDQNTDSIIETNLKNLTVPSNPLIDRCEHLVSISSSEGKVEAPKPINPLMAMFA